MANEYNLRRHVKCVGRQMKILPMPLGPPEKSRMRAIAIAVTLSFLFHSAPSQEASNPKNFKAFGCTIDDSDDTANIGLFAEKRELTVLIVDKRQVPRFSFDIFRADKSDSTDWESHDARFDGYLTINWFSLGYRLNVYSKDKSKHFEFSGQCKKGN
jgi:hypothetical protein